MSQPLTSPKTVPLCRFFGECGGCSYQDLAYVEELEKKEGYLKNLFQEKQMKRNYLTRLY